MKVILQSLVFLVLSSQALSAMDKKELDSLVALIDERQRNTGDYKARVLISETDGKTDKAFEATVYRRDADQKWMILFSKPKSEAGRGYLRVEKNLFMYEPSLGKWERKTERASIVGTGSQRSDFDGSKLTEEFVSQFIASEKLGKYSVTHLKLTAKKNVDVGYPIQELWVDVESKNILKREDRALSGKLMRTVLYPSWDKRYSESKKGDVYVPKDIRIFDEVEKANKTVVNIQEVDFKSLEENIFTKAWIESKSK